MRKILSLFVAALFAGSMFAADAKVTLDLTDAGWNFPSDYDKTEKTYTNGGVSITFGASNNGHKTLTKSKDDPTVTGIIFGKKNATLSFPAMTFNVSKIVVYWVSASGSAAVVHNIFVGEDAVSEAVTGCKVSAEADSSVFNIAAAKQAAGNVYVLKVTSDHNMQVSKVEFYEAVAGAPEIPVFSVPEGYYDAAQTVELSCPTTGAKIYYTLDGTTPTSASAEYSAALTIDKTTTVKAIAINNSISSELVAATYTIISTTGKGTKDDPYTLEDVVKWNNKRGSAERYWVKGIILGCAANEGKLQEESKIDSASIALGDSLTQVEGLIPVQLAKTSAANKEVREALNVKGNPENIGKQVLIYGKLEAYFNYFGVKDVTEYEWVTAPGEKSHDASIKSLTVNGAAVTADANNVFAYEVPANENIAEVEVVFTLAAKATADKESPFKLAVPASSEAAASEATINVTAEDGTTKKAYKVSVTRAAAEQGIEDVLDANQAVKFIENGQIVILKNGQKYNVQGQAIR